jgi:DNA helicase II / ATP-dependent DNA helicase PcrA
MLKLRLKNLRKMNLKLNTEQKKAVEHKEGPLLIIAGAGTGKTQVITQRIVNLMNKDLAKPGEILALTFTEKAAREMEERVDREMPLSYEEPTISTFHSFCDAVLRQEAFFLGIDPDYKLMNEAEANVFFKKHLFDLPLDELRPLNSPTKFVDVLLKHFSRLQDEDVSSEEYLRYSKKSEVEVVLELAKTYKKFGELKLEKGRMTFADLITMTLKLFREKSQILEKYQSKYKYVLVDEFQDTNYSQNVLVNTLILGKDFANAPIEERKKANITVVGDDDQAIYKFRGAAISNILQFKEIYPEAERVVLTKNYRSNQEILDSAYALIKNNNPYRLEVTEGIEKRLISKCENVDGAVQLIPTVDALEEAEAIAMEIKKLVEGKEKQGDYQVYDSKGQSSIFSDSVGNRYSFSDIAILVRANAHADEITPLLRYYKIPYKFAGKKGLYSRPEVKFFISFLKTLKDYQDNVALFNVLQLDVWNFEIRDFIEIFSEAKRRRVSAFEFLEFLLGTKVGSKQSESREILLEKTFSKDAVESLNNLMKIYEESFEMLKEGRTASDIIYFFLTQTGYLKHLESGGPESEFKLENIAKFFRLVKGFEQNNKDTTVYEYIDYLEHSIDIGETPSIEEDVFMDFDAVNISTVHGAKGLEFSVVFMPCLVKERFPSRNMSEQLPVPKELVKEKLPDEEDSGNIQEERRLFYVGATRAKERLFLTAAQYYGEGKRAKKPSIFLNEILERENLEEFDNVKASGVINFSKDTDVDDIDYSKFVKNLGESISYSEINDYEVCPKKYKYKYVLKIPVPMGHQATFGTIIHATLKDFYGMLKSSQEGLEGIFKKPTLDDLFGFYDKHWRSNGFENREHEKKKKKQGYEMLKNFFENSYTGEEKIIDLEKRFRVNVDGVLVTGVVDRVDVLDSNGVQLLDYKTGKEKEQKEVEKDVQLMIYGLFAREVMGAEEIKASLLFLDKGIKIDTAIDSKKLDFVKEKVVDVANLIKKSKFEAKPDKFYCKFCDYRDICDDACF